MICHGVPRIDFVARRVLGVGVPMEDPRALALLEFVRRNLIPEDAGEITLDTPLLSDNLIDSMGITMLAAFIEEQFNVICDGTELRKGRVESVRAIISRLGCAA